MKRVLVERGKTHRAKVLQGYSLINGFPFKCLVTELLSADMLLISEAGCLKRIIAMAKTKEAKLAKKAAAKELKKEKQLLKANKKKCKEAGLDTGEEDLFALLKKYEAKASAQDKAIGQLVNCSQPSPRALGSLTSLPTYALAACYHSVV